MNDKRRLILLAAVVVIGIGAAAYTWYPRLFPPKRAAVRPPVRILEAPTPVEVPAQKPAPAPAAKLPAGQVAKAPPEPPKAKAPEARPAAPTPGESQPARFGLEFPPLVTVHEADECERRLKQDGLTTVRSVTHMDDGLYAVVVGPFPTAAKASEAMAALQAKPGAPPGEQGGPGEFFFQDGPYNLRGVIQRATEVRGKGHKVRITRVAGKAPIYRIRTATRLDSAQASKLSGHYRELGCPNRVVAAR